MDIHDRPTSTAGITVTIAESASLSGVVNLGGMTLCGIVMPSAWTTAGITLQAATPAGTLSNLYDAAGNEVTITAAASRFIRLTPEDFAGFHLLKVRSGTGGTPVNQVAARELTLIVRPL